MKQDVNYGLDKDMIPPLSDSITDRGIVDQLSALTEGLLHMG
jgi:hypothetical protein